MTAKIDLMGPSVIALTGAPKAVSGASPLAGQASASPAAAVDKVSLSGDAVRMHEMSRAGSSGTGSGIDHAKVASLRAAIASGQYAPDPHKIASSLSRMEWDLGG